VVVAACFAAVARADFTAYGTSPIGTGACPGFAPTYPDFPDPIEGTDPGGEYVFQPSTGIDARIHSGQVIIVLDGSDPFADFHVSGVFHANSEGIPVGFGELRIVRGDGARVWGVARISYIPHRQGGWRVGFEEDTVHCLFPHS
jgi:hypothetical protein